MQPRIMYNNLLISDYISSVSSQKAGQISNVRKEGTGSASMQALGDYSGTVTAEYTIEIDSIIGGQEVGEATFAWEDGLGDSGNGVLTSSTEISLSNGVTVKWTGGSGNDFVLGDKWYFKGINYFQPGRMVDLDRDRRYRSVGLDSPNYVVLDLSEAEAATCFIVYDHNFSDDAVVKLQANTSDSWSSPPFEETLTIVNNSITKFFDSASYRYWRLYIDDSGNEDGYIQIGELFLGNYHELSMGFYYGHSNNREVIASNASVLSGVKRYNFQNIKRTINLSLTNPTKSQIESIFDILDSVTSRNSNLMNPVFLYLEDELYLVYFKRVPMVSKAYGVYSCDLEFEEVLTSV